MPVKLLIAGGFGVGKTTAVASVSEITPLTTEALITEASAGIDDNGATPEKATTTVALDFGWIVIDEAMKLYLFGTPGQDRFGFMWNDLTRGALGALVIVDSRRLDDAFPAIDYFEGLGMPFVVAVNLFDGRMAHDPEAIRWALAVADSVPVMVFDARDRRSVRDALLAVMHQSLALVKARTAAQPGM
ncbi:GTP-binding protein [Streptacidiphilus griseoplanus]|uniref:GTP-binding protein n=1 Tax=Peterkaempfera griseoplana TaxID=66896 RepID=UPI0006E1E5BD|nr:ATP/GTP-binding protein [Peterkaempfera griseoplana]